MKHDTIMWVFLRMRVSFAKIYVQKIPLLKFHQSIWLSFKVDLL